MSKAEVTGFGRQVALECLSVRVRRLGRIVTRIYDAALAGHGVTTAQFNLLAAIAVGEGARPAHLSQLLDVEKSTLSRDLNRMERLGWLRSEAVPGGGRVVELTVAGSRLLLDVRDAWKRAQAAARAELGHETFAQLRNALASPLDRGRARAPTASGRPAATRRRSTRRRRGGKGP